MVQFTHKFVPGRTNGAVLLLHGTGGDENDLLPIGKALAPGAALLSPRGQAWERGETCFFEGSNVAQRAGELVNWLRWAQDEYKIDPAALYALGYANGAEIAYAAMLLHPGCLAGAFLLRPGLVIEPDPLPDLNGAPVMICAGQGDPLVPPTQTEALARLLTLANANVEAAHQNATHELTPDDFSLVKYWMQQRFPPPPAPH